MKTRPNHKSIRMEIDFWYDEETDQIHIVSADTGDEKGLHTTINKKEGSLRRHDNLYDKLALILKKHGKHP